MYFTIHYKDKNKTIYPDDIRRLTKDVVFELYRLLRCSSNNKTETIRIISRETGYAQETVRKIIDSYEKKDDNH